MQRKQSSMHEDEKKTTATLRKKYTYRKKEKNSQTEINRFTRREKHNLHTERNIQRVRRKTPICERKDYLHTHTHTHSFIHREHELSSLTHVHIY